MTDRERYTTISGIERSGAAERDGAERSGRATQHRQNEDGGQRPVRKRRPKKKRRARMLRLIIPVLFVLLLGLLIGFAVSKLSGKGSEDPLKNGTHTEEPMEEEGGSKKFVDVMGKEHEYEVDREAFMTAYKDENFRKEGNRLVYEDDNWTSRPGIDVSKYQGTIDWKKVADAGFEFVYIRAGYRGYTKGSLAVDPMFEENILGARRAGLEVGVYFFSQAVDEKEAEEEADFVLDLIAPYRVTLPVVYDPETITGADSRTDGLSKEQLTANCIAFTKRVEEAGMTPMIYANMIWQAYKLDMGDLRDRLFWYADYEPLPQTPYRYKMLQYTDEAKVDGISENVDLDIEFIPKH